MTVFIQFFQKLQGRWVVLFSFLALLCGIVMLISHRDGDNRRDFSFGRGGSYIEGLKIIDKKSESGQWVITARRADFSKDETTASLVAVTILIEKENIRLSADKARYDLRTKELFLEDNIKVERGDTTVSAKSISWDPDQGVLVSGDSIEIAGKNFLIQGEGLSAQEDTSITRMKNVKATLY